MVELNDSVQNELEAYARKAREGIPEGEGLSVEDLVSMTKILLQSGFFAPLVTDWILSQLEGTRPQTTPELKVMVETGQKIDRFLAGLKGEFYSSNGLRVITSFVTQIKDRVDPTKP